MLKAEESLLWLAFHSTVGAEPKRGLVRSDPRRSSSRVGRCTLAATGKLASSVNPPRHPGPRLAPTSRANDPAKSLDHHQRRPPISSARSRSTARFRRPTRLANLPQPTNRPTTPRWRRRHETLLHRLVVSVLVLDSACPCPRHHDIPTRRAPARPGLSRPRRAANVRRRWCWSGWLWLSASASASAAAATVWAAPAASSGCAAA